ncbi:hypothetical protein GCM10027258_92810 [Amycolatopsis stemonae]
MVTFVVVFIEKTTTWVRLNWTEFRNLIEDDNKVVIVTVGRNRIRVACALSMERWREFATARGMDPENVQRKGGHDFRQTLSNVWQDAKAGQVTVAQFYDKVDTLAAAPLAVLPDDVVVEEAAAAAG